MTCSLQFSAPAYLHSLASRFRTLARAVALCSAAALLLAGALHAQPLPLTPSEPPTRAAASWTSFETAHFVVHTRTEFSAWARTTALRLEAIHAAVASAVGFAPGQRITVLVDDPSNTANGNAISWLDAPQISLYPVPPDPRSQIGRSGDWGELLAVHEVAHVAHLTRDSRGGRTWLRWFPGRFGPLTRSPRWVKEGYATVIEGRLTGSGRPASPLRAAVLREWAVSGLLPSYGALDGTSGFFGGTFAYLMGSAFLEHLESVHGDSSLTALWRRGSARQQRSFSRAFEETFGDAPADVYARYTAELTANAVALERALDSWGRVEGRLEARITRGGGDPAVSPSGEFVALSLPGPVGEPGRVVVWSTDTVTDAARDSAQRARAERLSQTDPEDLLPVPQIPRGRSARYTLRDVNGASFREPRWFGDGERLLVIRSDFRGDGSVRPDVFEWTLKTGHVRRITRGAAISDADVLPGDTIAAGTRCYAGQCDIVRIDLRTGDVRTVVAGDAFTQFVRPRAMPDGRSVVASAQVRGTWRPVMVNLVTGERTSIGADVPWDRYDVTPARSGDAVLLTSEQSGVPQLVRHSLTDHREVTLSRVFGAAMAPSPFPGDTSLLYLSLHPRGYELRRLSVRDTGLTELSPELRARFISPVAGAVVRQLPRDTGVRFDTTATVQTRAYGMGSPRWNLFPMGAGGRDGRGVGGVVGSSDAIGRFAWTLLGMASADAGAERGGTLRTMLRLPRVSVSAELTRATLGVTSANALQLRDYARGLDVDDGTRTSSGEYLEQAVSTWTGAAMSAEVARRDLRGYAGLRLGASVHALDGRSSVDLVTITSTPPVETVATEAAQRSSSATRWHGFLELQRTFSASFGPADIRADVRGHVSRTHNTLPASLYPSLPNTEVTRDALDPSVEVGGAVTRQLLQTRLALDLWGALAFTYDAVVGSMRGDSPMEVFRVGGLPSLLINSSVLPQRIPAPWLSAGTLYGRDIASHAFRLRSVGALTPFASAVRSGGPWLRAAGVSADLSQFATPFSRVPGIAASAGVAFVFDAPSSDAVRAWAGVSYTP